MSGTISKRIPFLMSVMFMILITVAVYRNTNDLEHIKSLTVLRKLQSEQQEVKIQTAAVPIAQPTNSRAYLIPDDDQLKGLSDSQLQQIYWNYINTIQVLCSKQRRVGSFHDGGKEICVDDKFVPKKPCLVYSFGSNNQFDFERDVYSVYGCELHTFDPSILTNPVKKAMLSVPASVTFHDYGLWINDTTNKKGWKLKSFESILKELNHESRVIDILKIDVEGAEWMALPAMLKSRVLERVSQICVEVHYGPGFTLDKLVTQTDQLTVLRQLYDYGFRIFMHERNLFSIKNQMTFVNEISLVNIHLFETS